MIQIGKGFDQEVEMPPRRFWAVPVFRLEDVQRHNLATRRTSRCERGVIMDP